MKSWSRLQSTPYEWWSCHSSYGRLKCKLCRNPDPRNLGQIYIFLVSRQCGPARWLALLLIKAGDVEKNLGTTATYKQVWICDICHKKIHGTATKPTNIYKLQEIRLDTIYRRHRVCFRADHSTHQIKHYQYNLHKHNIPKGHHHHRRVIKPSFSIVAFLHH